MRAVRSGKTRRGEEPSVVLLYLSFFLVGFFASTLISQNVPKPHPLPRSLQSVDSREEEFDLLTPGESGDKVIMSIPFQVDGTNCSIFELAELAASERATLDECEAMLALAASMQVEEYSLRAQLIQQLQGLRKKNQHLVRTI